jgi:hypothetical protein
MLVARLNLRTVAFISTVRSESHCALSATISCSAVVRRLVVSIEVAVEVCCCCVTFHCTQLLNGA